MGKFSDFMKKLYDYEEVDEVNEYGEYDMEEYDDSAESDYEASYDSFQEEVPYMQPETQSYIQQPVATTTPVRSASTATVVMLSPYDIRTSQIVCDHIREGHIVICNLTPNANNQRVVDYISGAVYSLDGKIEPTPVKTTFVCTPRAVELIVDNQAAEEGASKVSAL